VASLRIHYDDGTSVIADASQDTIDAVKRLERRERWEERVHRAHFEVASTARDGRGNKINLDALPSLKGPGTWTLGCDAIWSGPASLWLDESGRPLHHGQEPEELTEGGWRKPAGVRCRFCGTLRRLPVLSVCLGCGRTGIDHMIRPAKVVKTRRSYKPAKGLKGGVG
jgi:hypothetical protein